MSAHGVIRVAPSLAPFTGHDPAFRYYTFASNASLIDEVTYHLELGNGSQSAANWTIEYSLRETFGLPNLSVKSFAGLFLLLLTPGGIRDQFISFYNSGAPYQCDADCEAKIIAAQIWGPFPAATLTSGTPRHLLPRAASGRSINMREAKQAADPELCNICQAAMSLVDSLLAMNVSDTFIINTVSM